MTIYRFLRRTDSDLYFADREEAGRRLADRLAHLKGARVVVLGLPRGGVPVARQVAEALGVPLDVIIVRKLGVPWQPELAMGAIGEGGVRVLNQDLIRSLHLDDEDVTRVERSERNELDRRAETYRGDRPMVDLTGRTAVLVDDGIATGATAAAACKVARAHGAERVVLAAPVASAQAVDHLRSEADEVVVVGAPPDMGAIGAFYADFSPTSDAEVRRILQDHGSRDPSGTGLPGHTTGSSGEVSIALAGVTLPGLLTLPQDASSVVVFAHGSGSSRNSPRNRSVAAELNRAGHGTLLFDLLTENESRDRRNVFDIRLLAERLEGATRWLRDNRGTNLALGYFGASTGAAAALMAAADMGEAIEAVVSRGGRPDLAEGRLSSVTAPTLLIVGGRDTEVLALNRQAASHLSCSHELEIVAGATHLFEEPGALDEVARLAIAWFDRYLGSRSRGPGPVI